MDQFQRLYKHLANANVNLRDKWMWNRCIMVRYTVRDF